MKPSHRWALVAAIVVAIAIVIWLLWGRGEQEPAPAKGPMATQPQPPAPKPEPKPEPTPAPVAPKPEEPLTASVLFDYNRSAIRPGEAPKLEELMARIKGRALERLDAVGHADRIGSSAYNLRLSQRRAEAVRAYLAGKGMDAGSIRIEAKGEEQSVTGEACNNMGRENRKLIECLQPDRRVEITLLPKP
jgi:OOP family OmpA-OmpF porin